MNNRISLSSYNTTREKIKFEFLTESYGYEGKAQEAIGRAKVLEALLIAMLGMEEKKDYKTHYTQYVNIDGTNHIEITGKANVILALNLVLTQKNIFSLVGSSEEYKQWCVQVVKYLVAALEDGTLSRSDVEKLDALTKETLDAAYNLLKANPLAANLADKKINEDINKQWLKHPFYQLISLIIEDFNTRSDLYNKKSFFERMGSKKPDEQEIKDLFKQFTHFIPDCYCSMKASSYGYNERVGFDAGKISASRKIEAATSVAAKTPGKK